MFEESISRKCPNITNIVVGKHCIIETVRTFPCLQVKDFYGQGLKKKKDRERERETFSCSVSP